MGLEKPWGGCDAGGPQLVFPARGTGLENEAADADDAGRVGLQNAGVAALAYDAGGPLQPQVVSPARAAEADDAGRVGLEKPRGGS